jgi:hypothetical protein
MYIKTILTVSIFVLAWVLIAAQTAKETAQVPSIQQRVVDKIESSGKGVILGVAAHGEDVSALTTKLLDEVESNRYYAPVFFTSHGAAFQRQLNNLGLAQAQLPAVIYFNQHGKEISRITQIKTISNAVYHPKIRQHDDAKNADYLVALSQALSTL